MTKLNSPYILSQEDEESLIKTNLESLYQLESKKFSADTLKPYLNCLAEQDRTKIEEHLEKIKDRFFLSSDMIKALRSEIYSCKSKIKKSRNAYLQTNLPGSSMKVELSMNFEGLVDVVEKDGKSFFLIKRGDELICVNEHIVDGVKLIPPKKNAIPFELGNADMIIGFFNAYKEFSHGEIDKLLLSDLTDHHKKISELSAEFDYVLAALWVMHTYLIDKFHYSPIILFHSVPGRGKSRAGKGIIYTAYRGIVVETVKEAHIIRFANSYNASLFFDLEDFSRKVRDSGTLDIFLQRFERDCIITRVLNPDKGKLEDMTFFNLYGATIIASNESIDQVLETRTINISVPYSTKIFEKEVTKKLCLNMRERLTAFRAFHLDKQLPDTSKPSVGRLGDIGKPLRQILLLIDESLDQSFLEYIEQKRIDKAEENSDLLEVEILKAIFYAKSKIVNGKISTKDIEIHFNALRKKIERLSIRSIGKRISALGITRAKMNDGTRGILYKEDQINQLFKHYGIEKLLSHSSTEEEIPDQDEVEYRKGNKIIRRTYKF